MSEEAKKIAEQLLNDLKMCESTNGKSAISMGCAELDILAQSYLALQERFEAMRKDFGSDEIMRPLYKENAELREKLKEQHDDLVHECCELREEAADLIKDAKDDREKADGPFDDWFIHCGEWLARHSRFSAEATEKNK